MRTHVLRGSIAAMYEFRPIETLASLPQPMLIAVAESASADDAEVRDRRLALDDLLRSESHGPSYQPRTCAATRAPATT